MNSVKDLTVERGPSGPRPGRGTFAFSDRYSVFDWGPMPDAIPGKGASLCTTGAHTFEALERRDIPTHYRGVRDPETGAVGPLGACVEPPTEMAVDLGAVPELPRVEDTDANSGSGPRSESESGEYDYDAYHEDAGDCFVVPLEVVFRNCVPPGSSLRRRSTPREHGLNREEWPDGVVELPRPVVEFSTKYEPADRYLSRAEADRLAGRADVDDLERLAHAVNDVVTDLAAAAGLRHEDGKIECLYVDGDLRVADVTGTLDENRFVFDGVRVSKEVLREHHRRAQGEWVAAVTEAKADHEDWRAHAPAPQPLAPDVVETASAMYGAFADAYAADRERFDAPPLVEVVRDVDDLL